MAGYACPSCKRKFKPVELQTPCPDCGAFLAESKIFRFFFFAGTIPLMFFTAVFIVSEMIVPDDVLIPFVKIYHTPVFWAFGLIYAFFWVFLITAACLPRLITLPALPHDIPSEIGKRKYKIAMMAALVSICIYIEAMLLAWFFPAFAHKHWRLLLSVMTVLSSLAIFIFYWMRYSVSFFTVSPRESKRMLKKFYLYALITIAVMIIFHFAFKSS